MNNKGQALVEFILILPVILVSVVILTDLGSIFVQKINLNNSMATVVELYQNNEKEEMLAYVAKENLKYEEKEVNDMVEITLKKNIKVSAPILSNVLGKDYMAKTSQTIYKGDLDETQ